MEGDQHIDGNLSVAGVVRANGWATDGADYAELFRSNGNLSGGHVVGIDNTATASLVTNMRLPLGLSVSSPQYWEMRRKQHHMLRLRCQAGQAE